VSTLDILKTELASDPLARGYSGMSDEAVAVSLNTEDRAFQLTSVPGSAIFNAIVPSEFSALLATTQLLVRDVFSLGDSVDVSAGTNTRQVLLNAFGVGTTTRANLVALVSKLRSRGVEIGFGRVEVGHVQEARR